MKYALTMLLMVVIQFGCGTNEPVKVDAGAAGGERCVDDLDCKSPSLLCAYAVADGCSAVGHCVPVPSPTCTAITHVCGCSGAYVPDSPCFYPAGYAGGPTTGARSCSDGGL